MMKILMTTLLTSAALVTGAVSRPTTSLQGPPAALSPEERAAPAPYRVLSSKRTELIVQPGLVRQSGALKITVGNRAQHTISYESEQKFVPGGGVSSLKVVDAKTRSRADFTLSDDGSKSTFAFGRRGSHSLDVNPDETLTYDGVIYTGDAELAAVIAQAGHVPADEVELLAGAIEVGNAELSAVNKGKNAKKAAKVLGVLIELLKLLEKQLKK